MELEPAVEDSVSWHDAIQTNRLLCQEKLSFLSTKPFAAAILAAK